MGVNAQAKGEICTDEEDEREPTDSQMSYPEETRHIVAALKDVSKKHRKSRHPDKRIKFSRVSSSSKQTNQEAMWHNDLNSNNQEDVEKSMYHDQQSNQLLKIDDVPDDMPKKSRTVQKINKNNVHFFGDQPGANQEHISDKQSLTVPEFVCAGSVKMPYRAYNFSNEQFTVNSGSGLKSQQHLNFNRGSNHQRTGSGKSQQKSLTISLKPTLKPSEGKDGSANSQSVQKAPIDEQTRQIEEMENEKGKPMIRIPSNSQQQSGTQTDQSGQMATQFNKIGGKSYSCNSNPSSSVYQLDTNLMNSSNPDTMMHSRKNSISKSQREQFPMITEEYLHEDKSRQEVRVVLNDHPSQKSTQRLNHSNKSPPIQRIPTMSFGGGSGLKKQHEKKKYNRELDPINSNQSSDSFGTDSSLDKEQINMEQNSTQNNVSRRKVEFNKNKRSYTQNYGTDGIGQQKRDYLHVSTYKIPSDMQSQLEQMKAQSPPPVLGSRMKNTAFSTKQKKTKQMSTDSLKGSTYIECASRESPNFPKINISDNDTAPYEVPIDSFDSTQLQNDEKCLDKANLGPISLPMDQIVEEISEKFDAVNSSVVKKKESHFSGDFSSPSRNIHDSITNPISPHSMQSRLAYPPSDLNKGRKFSFSAAGEMFCVHDSNDNRYMLVPFPDNTPSRGGDKHTQDRSYSQLQNRMSLPQSNSVFQLQSSHTPQHKANKQQAVRNFQMSQKGPSPHAMIRKIQRAMEKIVSPSRRTIQKVLVPTKNEAKLEEYAPQVTVEKMEDIKDCKVLKECKGLPVRNFNKESIDMISEIITDSDDNSPDLCGDQINKMKKVKSNNEEQRPSQLLLIDGRYKYHKQLTKVQEMTEDLEQSSVGTRRFGKNIMSSIGIPHPQQNYQRERSNTELNEILAKIADESIASPNTETKLKNIKQFHVNLSGNTTQTMPNGSIDSPARPNIVTVKVRSSLDAVNPSTYCGNSQEENSNDYVRKFPQPIKQLPPEPSNIPETEEQSSCTEKKLVEDKEETDEDINEFLMSAQEIPEEDKKYFAEDDTFTQLMNKQTQQRKEAKEREGKNQNELDLDYKLMDKQEYQTPQSHAMRKKKVTSPSSDQKMNFVFGFNHGSDNFKGKSLIRTVKSVMRHSTPNMKVRINKLVDLTRKHALLEKLEATKRQITPLGRGDQEILRLTNRTPLNTSKTNPLDLLQTQIDTHKKLIEQQIEINNKAFTEEANSMSQLPVRCRSNMSAMVGKKSSSNSKIDSTPSSRQRSKNPVRLTLDQGDLIMSRTNKSYIDQKVAPFGQDFTPTTSTQNRMHRNFANDYTDSDQAYDDASAINAMAEYHPGMFEIMELRDLDSQDQSPMVGTSDNTSYYQLRDVTLDSKARRGTALSISTNKTENMITSYSNRNTPKIPTSSTYGNRLKNEVIDSSRLAGSGRINLGKGNPENFEQQFYRVKTQTPPICQKPLVDKNYASHVRYKKPASILQLVKEKMAVRKIIRAYRAHRLVLIENGLIQSWKQQNNPRLVQSIQQAMGIQMSSNNDSDLIQEEPQDAKPGKIFQYSNNYGNNDARKTMWNNAKAQDLLKVRTDQKIKSFFRKQRSRTMREDELEPVKQHEHAKSQYTTSTKKELKQRKSNITAPNIPLDFEAQAANQQQKSSHLKKFTHAESHESQGFTSEYQGQQIVDRTGAPMKQRQRHVSIVTTNVQSVKLNGQKLINQYQLVGLIGQGSQAKVKKAIDTKKVLMKDKVEQFCAIKIFDRIKLNNPTKLHLLKHLKSEMAIMKKMDHPYIIKLLEIINDPDFHKLYLVMEYCFNGSLTRRIGVNRMRKKDWKQWKPLPENVIRKYFRQLIMALEYCHDVADVIHRDIKPDNILVDKNDDIKLSDFGISMELAENGGHDLITNNDSTLMCSPPEAFMGKMYKGKRADIWSCGVTLYFMVVGKYPFRTQSTRQALERLIKTTEPELPESMKGTQLEDLLKKLMMKTSEDRISISEIKKHPWVTDNCTQPVPSLEQLGIAAERKLEVNEHDLNTLWTGVNHNDSKYVIVLKDSAKRADPAKTMIQ